MNLAIVGSRTISSEHYDYMNNIMNLFTQVNGKPKMIVSGGASGADKYGEEYATNHNIKTKIFLPDWDKYGKYAGPKRNKDIIDACNFIIAFKDKDISIGTDGSIKLAEDKTVFGWIVNVITKKITFIKS